MIRLLPHQEKITNRMLSYSKGQVISPTGSGKTMCMIYDALRRFSITTPRNIVVVAPRILLTEQLCSEFLEHVNNANVLHVHSGETEHYATTKSNRIHAFANVVNSSGEHCIFFTTYHSLHKIQEANIKIDTIYFDEAHNSVKKNFFSSTEYFSHSADRCYFFTATPKHSVTVFKPGMNNGQVYGQVISEVPAPELVKNGIILPPKIRLNKINMERDREFGADRDCMTLLDTIVNEDNMEKVLVAAPNTKVLMRMLAETEFMSEIRSYGYDVLWITSKYGAFINDTKVSRDVFFETLTSYGKDSNKKFIILHYSILSEGINCPGLTSCILMRNMDVIQMCQTIGRVIRIDANDREKIKNGELVSGDLRNYSKAFGVVHVPVYENVGIATAKRLESIVEEVFVQGNAAVSVIRR
tara:strand:- start:25 stop:1263 length:1239 start_codon:yes stop_codon:yes gene_type:complete